MTIPAFWSYVIPSVLRNHPFVRVAPALAVLILAANVSAAEPAPFRARLKALPFKIAYESYVNNNWEIFIMNPDGTNKRRVVTENDVWRAMTVNFLSGR